MEYLKETQYYVDLYDLFTIKECLRTVKIFQEIYVESLKNEKLKDLPKEEKYKGASYLLNWELFAVKTREYKRKKETIQEWMERDRKKQEKCDTTSPPQGIMCPDCKIPMISTTKHLWDFMDEPFRVLFFFECSNCKKHKGIYEDGEERIPAPRLCSKCGKTAKTKHSRKKNVITSITTCTVCGYKENEIDDLDKSDLEYKKKEQDDKALLEKYRKEYCLSEVEGNEHVETLEKMKLANEVFEEEKQKYDTSAYQKTSQLSKLNIIDLEKKLLETLEQDKYVKLTLDKPEIGQHILVPFTVQDANSSRKSYESIKNLESIVKNALEETNWRLVSNSTIYRLGFVFGKLKGYEQEEDLLEISGIKKEQKKSKIDPEKLKKYGSDNYVQLAKMFGKHEGIENTRKKRLEKEPEGFFLEPSESPYTCGICGENRYGEEIWWNLDGLRCADCWRNIKEGAIPSLKHRYEKDSNWFQDWQLRSDYGVHSATANKLKREGILKGRDLKKANGTIYYTVYLNSENQEFLKRYPKKTKSK